MLIRDAVGIERVAETNAMASRITVRLVSDESADDAEHRLADALQVFHDVDRTCTRFDPTSDLMRANAQGEEWVAVSPYCFDAIVEAYAAYRRTFGRFDPRVLGDLVRLGYDRSLKHAAPSYRDATALVPRMGMGDWRPEFRRSSSEVRVGPVPIDLGGIGKGLAVRWAADRLRSDIGSLVEAGGDCLCRGVAANGAPWRVGVEDPDDPTQPLAVLAVRDAAVATSSVRIRSWQIAGHDVHHLIDPRSGQPGGQGLAAVTVVDTDPATAEVASKTLFLTGRRGVRATAEHLGLAALWVDENGVIEWSQPLASVVEWSRP
ncbi:MAG TPA: FAD:protein FMN transferase [Mycobacteriales bacterium]|nr:FAD:protein FMN transferase [Mycobacteriales bacterium]